MVAESAPAPTNNPPEGTFPDFAAVGPHTVDFRGLSDDLREVIWSQLAMSFNLSPVARLALIRTAGCESPIPAVVMLNMMVAEMTPIIENLSIVVLLQRARTMFLQSAVECSREALMGKFADWRRANSWFDELLGQSTALRAAFIDEYAESGAAMDPMDGFAISLGEGRRSAVLPSGRGVVWSFPEGLQVFESGRDAQVAEAMLAKATVDEVTEQSKAARQAEPNKQQ